VCVCVCVWRMNKISKVLFTASQLHKYPSGDDADRAPFFSSDRSGSKQETDKRQQGPGRPGERRKRARGPSADVYVPPGRGEENASSVGFHLRYIIII